MAVPVEQEEETLESIIEGLSAQAGPNNAMSDFMAGNVARDKDLEANPMPTEPKLNGALAGAPPADLWTLDDMEHDKPIPCMYMKDPKRVFMARPLLHTPYVQKRLAMLDEYNKHKGKGKYNYTQLMVGISEAVHHLVVKMTAYRTVTDGDGEPILDDEGHIVYEPMDAHDAIDEMKFDQLIEVINAVAFAIQGEAKG